MEDGSWDFYEKRNYNSADIQKWEKKTIDLELTPKLHQQSPRIRNNFQYFFQDCGLDHHYNNFHNKISSLFQNV